MSKDNTVKRETLYKQIGYTFTITNLLAGNSADSAEITAVLRQVKEVQDNLVVANAQASSARSRLISL